MPDVGWLAELIMRFHADNRPPYFQNIRMESCFQRTFINDYKNLVFSNTSNWIFFVTYWVLRKPYPKKFYKPISLIRKSDHTISGWPQADQDSWPFILNSAPAFYCYRGNEFRRGSYTIAIRRNRRSSWWMWTWALWTVLMQPSKFRKYLLNQGWWQSLCTLCQLMQKECCS